MSWFFNLFNNDTKVRDWTDMNCLLQLDNLKPGIAYSFRLRVVPVVVPPLAAPQSPPPSDIAVFSTLPAAPSQPSPPVLVSRARTSLKVLARQLQSFRFLAILHVYVHFGNCFGSSTCSYAAFLPLVWTFLSRPSTDLLTVRMSLQFCGSFMFCK